MIIPPPIPKSPDMMLIPKPSEKIVNTRKNPLPTASRIVLIYYLCFYINKYRVGYVISKIFCFNDNH